MLKVMVYQQFLWAAMDWGSKVGKNVSGPVFVVVAVISLLHVTPVSAVLGDLNRDGRVDIDDFFLFASNFGKIGSPEPTTSLRFDGAYWRVDSDADSLRVEWLRFTEAGTVQRLRTEVFSPGALEAILSSLDSTDLAPRGYKRTGSAVSFIFHETSTGTVAYVPYTLDLSTGDRLISSRNGHQYDFMAFRASIPDVEFVLVENVAPDTIRSVVHDTTVVTIRDTIESVIRDTTEIVRRDTIETTRYVTIHDTLYLSLSTQLRTEVRNESGAYTTPWGRVEVAISWKFLYQRPTSGGIRVDGTYELTVNNRTSTTMGTFYHANFYDDDGFKIADYYYTGPTGTRIVNWLSLGAAAFGSWSKSEPFFIVVPSLEVANSIEHMNLTVHGWQN
jgi:hypothetical protein